MKPHEAEQLGQQWFAVLNKAGIAAYKTSSQTLAPALYVSTYVEAVIKTTVMAALRGTETLEDLIRRDIERRMKP